MSYLKGAGSTRVTPQSAPIPGREAEMKPNLAGGYVFSLEPLDHLRRFLILGTEGGTYYATQGEHTAQAVAMVRSVLDSEGAKAVEVIREVSQGGLAAKNDPAIYALAMAAGHSNPEVRKAALAALPDVCRIGTHLFTFVDFVEEFRGWGRGLRKAVGGWYTAKDADKLAYQAVKYRQRGGVTHGDVLRLAHPQKYAEADDPDVRAVLSWIAESDATRRGAAERRAEAGAAGSRAEVGDLPRIIEGFERAQKASSPADTAALVREYGLPREALLTEHLNSNEVWTAMLEAGMPITAMVRNLATMTRNGLLTQMSDATRIVTEQMTDPVRLRKGRVHPIALLGALATYGSGRSARGSGTWSPVARVMDALDAAFYLAFEAVEPSNKRTLLALDVSASMGTHEIAAMPGVTPRVGSAAMALITAATEPAHEFVAFTAGGWGTRSAPSGWGGHGSSIVTLAISPRQRLDDVIRGVSALPFGGTDCALPMLWAQEHGREIDTFVIYTDNETWAGGIHPSQALKQYRQAMGIDAKLVVVGMTATEFSIADPADRGMLDVVGFDPTAPRVITEFAAGRV